VAASPCACGTNSFISGSDPLYIVDGVIIDNGSGQLTDLGGRAAAGDLPISAMTTT